MNTFGNFVATGAIVRIEVDLEGRELPKRLLFGTPGFVQWLGERIERNEGSPLGANLTPVEQLDYLFHSFISGGPFVYSRQFGAIRAEKGAAWELKTVDFRIFGWFAMKDCFVAVFGGWADHVKDHDLYRGYRLQVRRPSGSSASTRVCALREWTRTMFFRFDIGAHARSASRLIGDIRNDLVEATVRKRVEKGWTQQQLADLAGMNCADLGRSSSKAIRTFVVNPAADEEE